MFDTVVSDVVKILAPKRLYHYTAWPGAEGILASQRFWATAHDCTNDKAELVSADAIIMEIAESLRRRATGAAVGALDLFLDGYPRLQITQLKTVYLACFSVARDQTEQWRKYGDSGRGVCLGIQVLDEVGPADPNIASKLMEVEYSESSWRDSVTKGFTAVCSLLARVPALKSNLESGLLALYRIAAFRAITAKQAAWKNEQEYRHVTLVHNDALVVPLERRSGAKAIRYLPINVRADGKRIAFSEIIVGSEQEFGPARDRLIRLLADTGYKVGDTEYPDIVQSEVPILEPI